MDGKITHCAVCYISSDDGSKGEIAEQEWELRNNVTWWAKAAFAQ